MAGTAEAGAAVGTAISPGVGTAIGGLLGGMLGGNSSSPAGPSILDALTTTSNDFSGWTVATHGSKASATNSKTTPDMASSLLGGGQGSQLMTFGIVAIAALVAIKIFKK